MGGKKVNIYGLLVSVVIIIIGVTGALTGSLLLFTVFGWATTIVFWLLVVLWVWDETLRRRRVTRG